MPSPQKVKGKSFENAKAKFLTEIFGEMRGNRKSTQICNLRSRSNRLIWPGEWPVSKRGNQQPDFV